MNDQTPPRPDWKSLTGPEKGDLIRPLITEQLLPYSQIARMLGVSRNAIAAAADRNRILSPLTKGAGGEIGSKGGAALRARTPKNPKVKTPRPERPRMSRIAPTQPMALPDDLIDKTPLKKGAWDALPGTTPRPLDQREPDQCSWPLGDGRPFLFCCAPAERGKVYCAAHNRIAFKPREERKKGTP